MTEKFTYTTIFESIENQAYELKTLVHWRYFSTLVEAEKQISNYLLSRNAQAAPGANSIDSKELNLVFHDKMSELINIINSTKNPADVLAQNKKIDKLFLEIISPELKALTESIKAASASIMVSKYLIDQNFIKTLTEVEALTTVAERASNLYTSDKNDAEYKMQLWGIKTKIEGVNKEGIFTKELEQIKALEAQFQLENFSHRIEILQEDFARVPDYLNITLNFIPGVLPATEENITLNFIPGVLPATEDLGLRYGKALVDYVDLGVIQEL